MICLLIFVGRGKERNINRLPPIYSWTGDQTHNLGMCPGQESNLQPFWCAVQCSNQPSHLGGVKQTFWSQSWEQGVIHWKTLPRTLGYCIIRTGRLAAFQNFSGDLRDDRAGLLSFLSTFPATTLIQSPVVLTWVTQCWPRWSFCSSSLSRIICSPQIAS